MALYAPSGLHGKRLVKSIVTPASPSKRRNKRFKEGIPTEDDDAQLSGMPEEVLCNITSFLDVHSLLNMRLLNRTFRSLASSSNAGWENICQVLWSSKIHVLPEAEECADRMAAYRMSVIDARDRDHILREELVFDPATWTGTVWSFRFKEAAGEDWTSWDPWFNGDLCRKMVFLDDGTVKQAESLADPSFSQSPQLIDPPVKMSWRYLTRPLDMPAKPMGSYIRFTVGGRDVPTYCVRRSPTNNWGFIMESCWGVYASFELPNRPKTRRNRVRLRRAQDQSGNWYNVEVHDDESSDEEEDSPRNVRHLLIDDDSFAVTSGLQWKEAFLYNFGARRLPEGDDAVAEFERTYGAALNRL